uniref:cAMP regulated phosphoprotein 21 n=2 Tax=Bos TaxID=9903 RepID=A0AAF6ZHD7_BOVIN
MSEPGDLSQTIVEEGGPEQETATPENGVIKSESLDEEEKLELQRRLVAQNQERRKSKSGAGKGKLTRSLAVCEESSARPGGESLQDQVYALSLWVMGERDPLCVHEDSFGIKQCFGGSTN